MNGKRWLKNNMIKTLKQQYYNQSRCSYCNGSGVDTFNHSKPCPNCNSEEVILNKQETRELRDEKIKFEYSNGEY